MKTTGPKEPSVDAGRLLTALKDAAAAIRSARAPDEMLHSITVPLGSATGFRRLLLLLLDPEGGTIASVHGAGLDHATMASAIGHPPGPALSPLLSSLSDEFVDNIASFPTTQADSLLRLLGPGAAALLPLRLQERPFGLLIAVRPDHGAIPSDAREMLTSVSTLVSLALPHLMPLNPLRGDRAALGLLMASIAHEINNPLAGLIGYTEQLVKTAPADIGETAHKILKEAERVRKITRALLGFARKGAPVRSPVDLRTLAADVLAGFSREIKKAAITVVQRLSPGCYAAGEGDLLRQALSNIVSNAIHALEDLPGNRLLEVGCEIMEEQALFWVRDNGRGIPQELLGSIFLPFFTTKDRERGTGLGLFIAGNIIDSHGGEISVESSSAGTTFRIRLSAAAAAEHSERPLRDVKSTSGARILVVDDEEAIRDSLKELLTRKGHAVDTAGSSPEALSLLEQAAYQVIVCDFRLREVNTADLYEQMENRDEAIGKTIFITGDRSSEKVTEFLRSTNALCLTKPFRPQDLFTKIEQILHSPRRKKDHFAA